mmetsp:Transcript_56523/g.63213  ORF Transcript_56523/g.63213 Transcript_56523/m.63213 type:complete len:82 (-) Transcript_56523:106-351(-)
MTGTTTTTTTTVSGGKGGCERRILTLLYNTINRYLCTALIRVVDVQHSTVCMLCGIRTLRSKAKKGGSGSGSHKRYRREQQ